MLLVMVQVLDEPDWVLVQHGKVVAHWTASTMWGGVAKKLLERLDFRVEEVDATAMVESFKQLGDEDDTDWDIPALIQEVVEEFGLEALGRPLERDQALRLWEKARMLNGLTLEEDALIRGF